MSPLVIVLATLNIVTAVREHSNSPEKRERLRKIRTDSLRPPTLDVPFRGREEELSLLIDPVKRSRYRFALVCGPGGAGKDHARS